MAETYTQSDLDNLNDAIKKGARRVKYQDKEIEYRSLNEMFQIREDMRRCLGLKVKSARVFAEHCKGLK